VEALFEGQKRASREGERGDKKEDKGFLGKNYLYNFKSTTSGLENVRGSLEEGVRYIEKKFSRRGK